MDRKLKMKYSFKDLACLMDVSYATIRNEVTGNNNLKQRLHKMGWVSYQRFRREHVLEIFKQMGFPDGYEWYEKIEC
jgi:hypothetical protein